MRFSIYTLKKKDLGSFEEKLPKYVFDNCEKKGFFTIGAVGSDGNLIGVTQFYIGILKDNEFISDIIYVYVKEEYRRNGAAGRMLWKSHNIIKKSGVKKSLVFLKDNLNEKMYIKEFFENNGYLFMKVENGIINEIFDFPKKITSRKIEQGVCWVDI
ncbi:MAG: GNAT family N-acetyltransferase [Lachnospiraceae bacterium]|nr:GNAT family N-acetyltransferase [Lachnospiraceae bacterium]